MSLEGTLREDPIEEVLLRIGDAGRTGILTLQGEQDIVALSFLDGGLVAADALHRTVEDGLREILVERGEVGAEEFVALASEHHAGGGRVIDLLLERGYLDRPKLLDALREQTERSLLDVMLWEGGEYKFYGGNEVFSEEGFEPIPVEAALLRAATELGAEGPFEGWTPDPGAVYEPAGGDAGGISGPLADQQRRLLELVDGRETAAELVAAAGVSDARGLLALQRLEAAGLVRRRPSPEALRRAQKPPDWDPEDAAEEGPEGARPHPSAASPSAASRLARRLEALGESLRTAGDRLLPWAVRLFALALVAGVLAALVRDPLVIFHPFPWERGALEEMRASRQDHRVFEIARAARAYHLLEGRFPESLDALVAAGLLSSTDGIDARGRPLTLSSTELSFVILAAEPTAGGTELVPAASGQVIGDALLDSAFLIDPAGGALAPLVLLD